MANITVNDALLLLDDYAGVQDGSIDQARRIRAIDTAYAYFQRKMTLPGDRKISSFYWSDDQFFYSAPTAFMEEDMLLYNNTDFNNARNEFEFRPDVELLRMLGTHPTKNMWSMTTINAALQLLILGNNQEKGSVIEDFDSIGDWVVAGDGSALTLDLLQKKVGDGSLSFDIVNSAGSVTLTDANVSLSVKTLFEKHGYFKFWCFMTDINIDDVSLLLYVDDSNYWTIVEDDLDDGNAFSANAWKKIGFPLDNATKTGTPEITETVTKIQLLFDLGAGLTSAADFRVDHLFTAIPDYLDFVYWSRYKGTTSGGTALQTFTATNNIMSISGFNEDLVDLIARRAALQLWPSLRADKEWFALYSNDLRELIKDFGRIWPRRRKNKFLRTRLAR